MPIQMFFAWRIYRLTKQNIIAATVALLSLVSFGGSREIFPDLVTNLIRPQPPAGGLWTTIMIIIIKLFKRKAELHWPALMWFLSATVADVLITGTLVMNLVGIYSD